MDNTRPTSEKKLGKQTTMLYKEPFMLRAGKRYIKAMAVTRLFLFYNTGGDTLTFRNRLIHVYSINIINYNYQLLVCKLQRSRLAS